MRLRETQVWATARRRVWAGVGRSGAVCVVTRTSAWGPGRPWPFRAWDGGSVQLVGLKSSCNLFLSKRPGEAVGKEFSLKLLGKNLIDGWLYTTCPESADYTEQLYFPNFYPNLGATWHIVHIKLPGEESLPCLEQLGLWN